MIKEVKQMNLGEKIKLLRKKRGVSQEHLAERLGISFQAVSKWETGATLPDVALIPAIASFFGVSTDELFDFDVYGIGKKVDAVVDEWKKYLDSNPEKAEEIIRGALETYPGNEVLLNCLLSSLQLPERAEEAIEIGRQLAENAEDDAVRIEAYCITAEAYRAIGEKAMCREYVDKIPETYNSSLYVKAHLLDGEESFEAAVKEKCLCFEHLVRMLIILSDRYVERGERDNAIKSLETLKKLAEAFRDDPASDYTTSCYDPELFESTEQKLKSL